MVAAKRRSGKALVWTGALLVLAGCAPLLIAILASLMAGAHGCTVNEAGAYPCIIGGNDWGGALSAMFVMGWLMMLTIWLVPAGLVVLVFGLVRLLRRAPVEPPA